MGLFDFLTGNADPDPSKPRLSHDELKQRLLALGDPAGRWHVRATSDDGAAELVAEWVLVDAQVIEWVRAGGTRATKRVLMRLADEDGVVRSVDHDGSLVWEAGLTGIRFEAAAFRGQSRQVGKTWSFGGSEESGETRSWDTDEIKRPLRQAVADAGWGWHGVAFAKL